MKRALSLLLSLAMVFTLAMPAFAQEPVSAATELPAPAQEETNVPEEPTDTLEDATTPEETTSVPTEDTVDSKEAPTTFAAAPAAAAPTIPGYTQVTSTQLDTSKYYLVVATDSNNQAYALYPDPLGLTANAGDTISTKTAAEGIFVAQLNIAGDKVTATHMNDSTSMEMDSLRYTVEGNGSSYAFAGSNSNYIALNNYLLSSTPVNLSVSMDNGHAVTLKNTSTNRILDLNKRGDSKEFKMNGKTFNTNFWAPYGSTRFSIYLYTENNAEVPVTVSKGELNSAIDRANKMLTSDLYTEASKTALNTALDAAKVEKENTNSTVESVAKATQALVKAMQAMAPIESMIAEGAPADGKTEGQPFPVGLAGSQTFRIPAITTLDDGTLAAAIDARWDACPDGNGIDTLFSISKDNGKTWEYTFPNFFNDSINKYINEAACFIDPVMVQDNDGTIYLLTDVFPGGHFIRTVANTTGYEKINGEQRMVLYINRDGQNSNNYDYYVGNFTTAAGETKGYAPVIDKNDESRIAYYVDDHYYLYTADKAPMYCQQLGSDKFVQQNVFFYNAELHVRNATYLWLITSNDQGKTWSAPTILNPQVRPGEGGATHRFYGVGPGAGLALKDGTVMLPCYVNSTFSPEKSSFVYTRDKGKTWHRSDDATIGNDWSSESTMVQINDTTVRQFCRDGHNVLRYTDHVWDAASETWVRKGEPVRLENVLKTSYNQLSAIRYSKPINGKPAILVSTAAMPGNSRNHGVIYTFTLNEDNTMELIGTYEITKPGSTTEIVGEVYGYSSLTEQSDGSIGLLYEETFKNSKYINLTMDQLAPGALIDGKRTIQVPLYGTYEDAFAPLPTAEDLKNLDSSVVTAEIKDGKVIFTGVGEGTASFTSNGITTTVNVVSTYPTVQVKLPCLGEYQVKVGPNPDILNNSKTIATSLEPVTVTGGQGTTGKDSSYNGEHTALALAQYTFRQNENGYEVTAPAADGTMTWLNANGAPGFPSSAASTSTKFIRNNDGSFFIQSKEQSYLYFWRKGTNLNTFDRTSDCGGSFTEGCKFLLYRPVGENEKSSSEIPGYVKVSEIQDGGQYLIVAQSNGAYYVMRPALGGSKFDQVLKVDPNAEQITTTIANILTFKALENAQDSNILVDGTVYQLAIEHTLTRVERVEATETKPGNILHWHCDVCGKNFLDEAGTQPVDDVVIPAGSPLVPIAPATPVPSEKPSEKPSQPNASNPTTGDPAALGLWIGTAVLSGAGIFGISRKRKEEQ